MISGYESKIGYIYGVFIILLLAAVVSFLLCDLKVLPEGICTVVNDFENSITQIVNSWTK